MLNKVMIIGRLGADPEIKYTQSGSPIANLRVATDESYTDRDGNRVERTEWHRIVVFQRAAENCNQYLRKGSLVYVEGKLTTRKWQDQNGQDRYTTEIKADRVQFLDRRNAGPEDGADGYDQVQAPRAQYQSRGGYASRNDRQGGSRGGRPQGQSGYGQDQYGASQQAPAFPKQPSEDEDLGPAFPSEASTISTMDDLPF